jgi:hypothetical protein
MEHTLLEIFHYMKETSKTLFYSKQKFFCEYTKCCIVVERFSNQFDLLFIPTKKSLEMLKSLIAEKKFIDTIKQFVEQFGFQNLFYRLRIQMYKMYETGPLVPGFIRCELYPGIVKYGQVYTKVRVVVEGEDNEIRDYAVKIDLMSYWSLRELSNFMATNETVNPIGFECANSFAKNYGEETTDEAVENDATLISEIYTKNLQITLFQGDFGTVLM